MNCRYTDEERKEDVERTIGIRARDIEKIQFCGLWHIRFRAFARTFIIIGPIPMIQCIWLSRPGNGSKDVKSRPGLAGFFLFSAILYCNKNRYIVK